MTEMMSFRIPSELAAELRSEAAALDRSVAWVIVKRLRVRTNTGIPVEQELRDLRVMMQQYLGSDLSSGLPLKKMLEQVILLASSPKPVMVVTE